MFITSRLPECQFQRSNGAIRARSIAKATANDSTIHARWIVNNPRRRLPVPAIVRLLGRDFLPAAVDFFFVRAIIRSLWRQYNCPSVIIALYRAGSLTLPVSNLASDHRLSGYTSSPIT